MNKNVLFIDPRTKIFLLFVTSTVMLSSGGEGIFIIIRPVVALLPFILLLTSKRYKAAFSYIFFYIIANLLTIYVMPYTKGFLNLVMSFISTMGTRFYSGAMMGFYFITSTKVNEFCCSMERLHVSQKIIIPFSVMFRFFPTIKEEAKGISDAMRIRGLSWKFFIIRPIEILEYRIVPLITCIVNIGNELSASALTRSLGKENGRTNISRSGFSFIDYFLFILGIAILLCMFIGK